MQLVLRDGRTLESGDIRFARGNAMAPLAAADLRAKFLDCASRAPEVHAPQLVAQLSDVAALPKLRRLAAR